MSESSDTVADADWPDLAGRLDGCGGHVLPVRVYFEDTDFSGVVYHATYVRWCERGRSDFLRLLGVHHHELIDDGSPAAFVVRRMEFDFRRPARIDEILEVRTRVAEQRAAYVWLDQEISRASVLLCKARVQVVLVSASGAPQRLGPQLVSAFRTQAP
ncbi:MAG: YbgC/FadM family acyl-CoA thioesterase [Pseudomonadota bacterium]